MTNEFERKSKVTRHWCETEFRTSDVYRAKRGISTYQALSAEILPRFARQDTSLTRKRQRLNKKKKSVILLGLLFFFLVQSSHALSAPSLEVLQKDMAEQLRLVVRAIDPAAQVTVNLTAKSTRLRLPGTPFSFMPARQDSTGLGPFLAAIDVQIFTADDNLKKAAEKVTHDIAASYGGTETTININFKKLSDVYLNTRQAVNSSASTSGTLNLKPWEQPFNEALKSSNEMLSGIKEASGGEPLAKAKEIAFIILSTLAAVCILLPLTFAFIWSKAQKQLIAAINGSAKNLVGAVEAGGGMATNAGANTPAPSRSLSAAHDMPRDGGSDTFKALAQIPEEGILALLSDCYWTEQDAYGAFLWRRIEPERKLKLIQRMPELGSYGTFLGTLSEEDLQAEQDPAYLQPLPIAHLDMKAVTNLVVEHPSILDELSPLRQASLTLKPSERLTLHLARNLAKPEAIPSIPSQHSTPRVFKKSINLQINNERDELEVLAFENPPFEVLEEVPSLGWMLKLEPQQIRDILQPFSAKDLASAWIGPKVVLEELATHVGDKKFEILKSHAQRNSPNRLSPAMTALHQMTIAKIRENAAKNSAVSTAKSEVAA